MHALLEALRSACPCGDHHTPRRHSDTRPRCQDCGHDHAHALRGHPCLTCDCDRPQSGRPA